MDDKIPNANLDHIMRDLKPIDVERLQQTREDRKLVVVLAMAVQNPRRLDGIRKIP